MPKRILMIDDDPTILQMLKLSFARTDFEVITANEGETGLKLFSEQHPDLILVDIAMPGIDGYQVVEEIRNRDDEGKSVPIIILTAHEQPVMRNYANEVGANLYLTKPVVPSKLIEHIGKMLGSK